ncbi:MAG TPA: hypothetical protein V6D33_11220 [Cyanophyceae cyanobacterium]
MNNFIRLTFKAVVITALVGSVTACENFPFLGRNRSSNQVESSPQGTTSQPTGQTRLRAGQPGTQGGTTNQTTAQAPQTTEGQGGATPGESTQSDGNQPVPALW